MANFAAACISATMMQLTFRPVDYADGWGRTLTCLGNMPNYGATTLLRHAARHVTGYTACTDIPVQLGEAPMMVPTESSEEAPSGVPAELIHC